eukprot:214373_1
MKLNPEGNAKLNTKQLKNKSPEQSTVDWRNEDFCTISLESRWTHLPKVISIIDSSNTEVAIVETTNMTVLTISAPISRRNTLKTNFHNINTDRSISSKSRFFVNQYRLCKRRDFFARRKYT